MRKPKPSALATVGAATAMVANAARTYETFFMMCLSNLVTRGENGWGSATFLEHCRWNSDSLSTLMNACSVFRSQDRIAFFRVSQIRTFSAPNFHAKATPVIRLRCRYLSPTVVLGPCRQYAETVMPDEPNDRAGSRMSREGSPAHTPPPAPLA